MYFKDKTVWITGASSRIGEALASELTARGASAILSGRNIERLNQVSTAIGGEVRVIPFEATEYKRCQMLSNRPKPGAAASIFSSTMPALVSEASPWTRNLPYTRA